MLIIDGKRITEADTKWYDLLKDYDKVVTIKAAGRYRPRRFSNGSQAPVKLNIRVEMRFTIQDPNRGGTTVSVIYSPTDNVPITENGMVDPKFQPDRYKITAMVNKIRKEENPELLLALILHPRNSHNHLYELAKKKSPATPVFTIARKGVVAVEEVDKDILLVTALSYLIGEKKVSDKKIIDTYTYYALDPDLIENEDLAGMIAALKEVAKADPAKFITDITDTMHDMKAKIKDAIDSGILVVNKENRKITWGTGIEGRDPKKTILQYGTNADPIVSISEYLVNRDTNGDVRETLLKQLELVADLV